MLGFVRGWGVAQAGIVAIVLSALWLANSLWLGRQQEAMAIRQTDEEETGLKRTAAA